MTNPGLESNVVRDQNKWRPWRTKIVICARDTLFEHIELWVEGCSAKIKVNSGSFSDPFKDVEQKTIIVNTLSVHVFYNWCLLEWKTLKPHPQNRILLILPHQSESAPSPGGNWRYSLWICSWKIYKAAEKILTMPVYFRYIAKEGLPPTRNANSC